MNFRPDVQGLRALAVGLVILDHAGFRTFSGGYVGVDVFFVISGFLITSLLLREAARTGRVSLAGFYARRARRILPAAAVVLVATLAASLLLLPRVRVLEIAEDAVWSAFFGANVRFATVGTDYFARGEPSSPLQHFWSLAVEEQFYLVWPVLLMAWLALAVRAGRAPRARSLGLLLAGLATASLVWSAVATHASPATAYFSTLTRGWELAAGAGAALWASRGGSVPAPLRFPLGAAGLGAVLVASVAYGAETPFPGVAAVLPVLGTVALLAAGGGDAAPTPVGRLLSLRPARVLGDWSYSLYLWHWPVLRVAEDRLAVDRLPLPVLAPALAVVLALSALTYRFVEEPFRRGAVWSRPRLGLALYPASVVLVAAVALAGRGWVVAQLDGGGPAITAAAYADRGLSSDPRIALVQASVLAAKDHRPVPGGLVPSLSGLRSQTASLGECDYRTGTTRVCSMGDPDAERSLVLLGDSHARAWSPALVELGAELGYAVHPLILSGCSATSAVQADWDTHRPWQRCEEFKRWAVDTVADLHPDVLVIATSAVSPVMSADGSRPLGMVADTAEFQRVVADGFARTLDTVVPLADRVVVLGNTPKLPREPGVCLTSGEVDLGDCLFRPGPVARAVQRGFRSAARAREVPFVNAMDWFCAGNWCPSVVGRMITMRDSEHVTPQYAGELSAALGRRLGLTHAGAAG